MELTHYAPLFQVTSVAPDDQRLFTDACWYEPGDYDPHRLFEWMGAGEGQPIRHAFHH
jgi:hypothetical protein